MFYFTYRYVIYKLHQSTWYVTVAQYKYLLDIGSFELRVTPKQSQLKMSVNNYTLVLSLVHVCWHRMYVRTPLPVIRPLYRGLTAEGLPKYQV